MKDHLMMDCWTVNLSMITYLPHYIAVIAPIKMNKDILIIQLKFVASKVSI